MWYTVIQLFLIGIRLRVGLADTLRHNLGIALLVAGVFAIFTLHAGRVLEKVSTQCTTHDVIELLENKFMAIELVYFLFPLSNSPFTVQTTNIEGPSVLDLFCCVL